jgi:hypothetical protein
MSAFSVLVPQRASYLRGVNFSGAAFTLAAHSSQQTTSTAPEGSFTSFPPLFDFPVTHRTLCRLHAFDPFQFLIWCDATVRPPRTKSMPTRHSPTFRFLLISRRPRGDNFRQADGGRPKALWNTSVKWLWLENPRSSARAVKSVAPASILSRAERRRRRFRY